MAGFFDFEGRDLKGFVKKLVLGDLMPYLEELSRNRRQFGRLFELGGGTSAVVVDEDYGDRGAPFAGCAAERGLPLVCVSHANMDVDFEVPASGRKFGPSETLVNSPFEKFMYASRGWDESRIHVLGTPRYDRLAGLVGKETGKAEKNPRTEKKILFCAATPWMQSPDDLGHLGCHVTCLGEIQNRVFISTLKALHGLPCEVWLKVHDYETEPMWRRLAERHGSGEKIFFRRAHEDFMGLVSACDAMVLGYWSTAMIEAGFCRKPVFYLDDAGIKNGVVRRFAEAGFCRLLQSERELRQAFVDDVFVDAQPARVLPDESRTDYYIGCRDGQSSARAAGFILEKAGKAKAGPA